MVRIETGSSIGTGFIYETTGQTAYVLTNEHVVSGERTVEVTVDEELYNGYVLGFDTEQDIAVLRICCGDFEELSIGDGAPSLGSEVVAIGHALGLEGDPTVSMGIVSALRWDGTLAVDTLQTDAAINSGNSGGPLLALDGSVVGMNTWSYNPGYAEAIAYAIDVSALRMRAPALANQDEMDFESHTYVKDAGPFSGIGSDTSWFWHSYVMAESFIAEVTLPNFASRGLGVGVRHSLADGLKPETESVAVYSTGCDHNVWDDGEWQLQDGVDARIGVKGKVRVVVDGGWRVYVDGELKCEHPWLFGRRGWITLSLEVPFENLTVWARKE